MAGEFDHRLLWLWTAPELLALLAVFGLLVTSLLGTPPLFAGELSAISRPLRIAGAAFVAIELLIPAGIWIDLEGHQGNGGSIWVHVAAMPLLNLFGLVAYLQDRQRIHAPTDPPG